MFYLKTKPWILGKSQNTWAIYYFFLIMNKRKKLTYKMVFHNKISQKGRKNKSKQIFPIRKIFSLNSSFWNSEKWRKDDAYPNISVFSLVTTLSASLLIQSVSLCIFNIPLPFSCLWTGRYYKHTREQDVLCIYSVYLETKTLMKTWKPNIHLIGIQFVNFSAQFHEKPKTIWEE